MEHNVVLSIRGQQNYQDQDPEVIELVTEGNLIRLDNGWKVSYEESDLTGLAGVTTVFEVTSDTVTLTRTGALNSQMVFQKGVLHESLYQMEFGALMIAVCATRVSYDLTERGGTIDLTYGIDIENTAAGIIEYHLDIKAK
jgi:uncharacterized beta-barrel protein YwiB (DUF1934 family)